MDTYRLHAAILTALLGLLAAGCGGGGERRLTHAELVREANAACAAPDALERLRTLRPPPEDAETFRRLLKAIDAVDDAEDSLERAIALGKAEGYALRLGLGVCARRHNAQR